MQGPLEEQSLQAARSIHTQPVCYIRPLSGSCCGEEQAAGLAACILLPHISCFHELHRAEPSRARQQQPLIWLLDGSVGSAAWRSVVSLARLHVSGNTRDCHIQMHGSSAPKIAGLHKHQEALTRGEQPGGRPWRSTHIQNSCLERDAGVNLERLIDCLNFQRSSNIGDGLKRTPKRRGLMSATVQPAYCLSLVIDRWSASCCGGGEVQAEWPAHFGVHTATKQLCTLTTACIRTSGSRLEGSN